MDEHLVSLDRLELPFIWGGDLNMRHADDRIDYFVNRPGDEINEVSSFCVENPERCEVLIRWDTDAPWYETQDLQGWSPGIRIDIEPIRMQEIFDAPVDGVMPSDHNGVLVDYRLSWPSEFTRPY